MMKLIRAGLMSAVMVVLMCSSVFAQGAFVPQGTTVIPSVTAWYKDCTTKRYARILLTNITGSNLKIRVTVRDHDGNDVTHYTKVMTGSNSYSA
ncbi:hypothetical protein D0S45_20475, partial [Marinifilum sp. JC120]